jgi:hypothetical protein
MVVFNIFLVAYPQLVGMFARHAFNIFVLRVYYPPIGMFDQHVVLELCSLYFRTSSVLESTYHSEKFVT